MAYDLEEQEKLDELKDWWNRHGTLVTALVVAAALGVLGYRAWTYYETSQSTKAARLYEQLDKAVAAKQLVLVREITGTMLDRFSHTAYAEMAALAAARVNVDAGDLKSAQAQLQWAADHAQDPGYRWVAKLRLAGVLLDQALPEDALKVLAGDVPANFEAAFDDRRGDILASEGKFEPARLQYQAALAKLSALSTESRTAYTNVIQLKLDALSSGVPVASAAPAAADPHAAGTIAAAPATAPEPK